MDFKEYVSANYKRLDGQTRELVEDAFKAGQQSKQDDLDELQKRINDALNEIESGITGKYHVKRIVRILKGD